MISETKQKALDKRDGKVLSAVKSRKNGLSFTDLGSKTGLEPNLLRGSLKRLRGQRKVKVSGVSRAMKYSA